MIATTILALLRKHWKIVAVAGIILLLLFAGQQAIKFRKLYRQQKLETDSAIALTGESQKKIEIYENKLGNQVSKNEALEFNLRTVQRLRKEEQLGWLEQFESLKKSLKNLEYAQQINAKALQDLDITVSDTTIYITKSGDTTTVTAKKLNYIDKWTSVKGTVYDTTADLKIEMNVPISTVVYWERKWFLGKKTWQVEATSENPYVAITGLTNINVKKK